MPGTRFDLITPSALAQAEGWFAALDRQVDWDWAGGHAAFRYRHPKRFEVSVWENERLTGLSMGRPTYNGDHLRLDVIEARPASLGERGPVFSTVAVAYTPYGRLLNAKQLRIMNPINDAVQSYYEGFGFQYVRRGHYLFKDLR